MLIYCHIGSDEGSLLLNTNINTYKPIKKKKKITKLAGSYIYLYIMIDIKIYHYVFSYFSLRCV